MGMLGVEAFTPDNRWASRLAVALVVTALLSGHVFATTADLPITEPPPEPSCDAPMLPCLGDCNRNAEVTIDEIIAGVSAALELAPVSTCAAMDRDENGTVTVEELVAAVRSALEGCPLERGAIYEVRACGEEFFRILVWAPELIAEAERILAGEEPRKIVVGELRCGTGNFNGPWSWHLEPDSIAFADFAIELCDGCPSFVQDDLEYWLYTVGRYCPWSAELVRRVR